MATRFYISDTLAPPVTFNAATQWVNPGQSNTIRSMSTIKRGSALNTRNLPETVAAAQNEVMRMGVSDELAAQTISGTVSAVFFAFEGAAVDDMALQLVCRVMSQDGQTVRATLYAGQAAALNATVGALGEEFALTPGATRIIPAGTALSSYTCVAGDRLTCEVGYRTYNVSTTSASTTMTFGDPTATADYALTSGLLTSLVPWVEFSGTILFAPPRRPVRALQAVNRAGTY